MPPLSLPTRIHSDAVGAGCGAPFRYD